MNSRLSKDQQLDDGPSGVMIFLGVLLVVGVAIWLLSMFFSDPQASAFMNVILK